MSLYKQNDYGTRVKWAPPPPKPRSSSGWGGVVLVLCLLVAIGLVWGKFAHRSPTTATTTSTYTKSTTEVADVQTYNDTSSETDESSSTDASQTGNTTTTDFDFHLNPDGSGSFYQSQELEVTATVEGLTNYYIRWTSKPELAERLHWSALDSITTTIRIRVTGDGGLGYSTDPSCDGENAFTVELYDQPNGRLLETRWLSVSTRAPLDIRLPSSAVSSSLINQPTIVEPEIEWEGDTVSSMSGMSFEWRWENGELAGTDSTFTVPDDGLSRALSLTVSCQGFSDTEQMRIN